ncbi:MAG: hypothetical protein N2053_07335, partial [Chitinispirillaceae bacterium]|nr:hypothetical protein [Chitinispirillaceae bacterium]
MNNKKGIVTLVFLLSLSLEVLSEQTSDVTEVKDSTKTTSDGKRDSSVVDTTGNRNLNFTSKFTLLPYSQADSIITKLISK